MHFHAEVWIKNKLEIGSKELEKQIEDIMLPYFEEGYDEEYNEDNIPTITLFDWYSIGGRWCGVHDKYDPTTNPYNKRLCFICGGSGDREGWVWYDIDNVRHFKDEWSKKCNGCNVCQGTGMDDVHPSDYKPYPGDIIAVKDIPDDFNCYTLIIQNKVYLTDSDSYGGILSPECNPDNCFDGNVKNKLKELGIEDGYLVTVDYHS